MSKTISLNKWFGGDFSGEENLSIGRWIDGSFEGGILSGTTWLGGNFKGRLSTSTARGGNFRDSVILNSEVKNIGASKTTFEDSVIIDSITVDGFFKRGSVIGGKHSGAKIDGSRIHSGIFKDSTFISGVFENGIWEGGVWIDGTWESIVPTSWKGGHIFDDDPIKAFEDFFGLERDGDNVFSKTMNPLEYRRNKYKFELAKKRGILDGEWVMCDICSEIIPATEIEEGKNVCNKCRERSREYLNEKELEDYIARTCEVSSESETINYAKAIDLSSSNNRIYYQHLDWS